MKLGIAMLIIGLLFAGFGVFLWDPGNSMRYLVEPSNELQQLAFYASIGKGLTVFGGGLTIGGIVRMIVKR
jgi:hypothetical protein